MRKTSRFIAATSALLFTLYSVTANAVFIDDGNYVRARTDLSVGPGVSGGVTQTFGAVTADSDVVSVVNGAWSGSGQARASNAGSGLQSVATTTAPDAGGVFPSSSQSIMTASWRDVLIPNSAGAPSELNFNFSVHAILSVSQTTDSGIFNGENYSQASVSAFADDSIFSFVTPSSSQMTARVRNFDGGVTTTTVLDGGGLAWNDAVFNQLGSNQYEFIGDFTFTSSLLNFVPAEPDAPFGAYFLGVGLSALSSNVGGTSSADAFSTMTLDSITTLDGTPISADDFVFESGAAISAVPLPGSLLLLLSGLLGGFGLTRYGKTS